MNSTNPQTAKNRQAANQSLASAPESQATIATREHLVKVKSLTARVDETLEIMNPLPVAITDLPSDVAEVLGPDERELWVDVEQRGREHLLEQALHRRISSAERRLTQLQRQDLCAYYIDTLCRLSESRRSEIGEEQYSLLRREFEAAKAAWEAQRVKGKRKPTRVTTDSIKTM